MNAQPARGLRGAVVWALTTFQPEAPFKLVGVDEETRSYAAAVDVAKAIQAGELEAVATFEVGAKIRPVVILQDRPRGELPEYAALKLSRFTKLTPDAQERVRNGDEPPLFHLPANKVKYGLKHENAVDLNSLVRVHESAMVTRAVGYLDETETDVLGRRLASFLDIDLEPAIREGVIKRWENIVAARQSGRKPS